MKPKVIDVEDDQIFDLPLNDPIHRKDSINTGDAGAGSMTDMQEKLGMAMLNDLVSLNKAESKKLLKYNNLYDKLRKKKNDLEILLAQRNFQIHFSDVKKTLPLTVNYEISKQFESNEELSNAIKTCEKVCLEESKILENIKATLQPPDIKVTESLLTDRYSKVSKSVEETEKEATQVS